MTTFHVCLDVEGLLMNSNKRAYSRMLQHPDGRYMTSHKAKRVLLHQLSLGRKVIPVGPKCDNFSYETGCLGHKVDTGK